MNAYSQQLSIIIEGCTKVVYWGKLILHDETTHARSHAVKGALMVSLCLDKYKEPEVI